MVQLNSAFLRRMKGITRIVQLVTNLELAGFVTAIEQAPDGPAVWESAAIGFWRAAEALDDSRFRGAPGSLLADALLLAVGSREIDGLWMCLYETSRATKPVRSVRSELFMLARGCGAEAFFRKGRDLFPIMGGPLHV